MFFGDIAHHRHHCRSVCIVHSHFDSTVLEIYFANVVNVILQSYRCFSLSTHSMKRKKEKQANTQRDRMDAVSFSYFLCFFSAYIGFSHTGNSHFTQLILVFFVHKQMTYKICDNRLFFPLSLPQCAQYPLEMSKQANMSTVVCSQ